MSSWIVDRLHRTWVYRCVRGCVGVAARWASRWGMRVSPRLVDIPGLLSADDRTTLAKWSGRLAPGAVLIEIGAYRGLSAAIMSNANRKIQILSIDPLDGRGDGSELNYGRAFAEQDPYQVIRENHRRYGIKNVRVIRATSRAALDVVPPACDMLFVDGSHVYEDVAQDVRSYGARLKPGGVLVLHDASAKCGQPGPQAVAQELVKDASWECLETSGACMVFRRRG